MKLELISFEGETFINDNVKLINVHTLAGELTILDNHHCILSAIIPSVLYIDYVENNSDFSKEFAVGRGVLQFNENNCKIILDTVVGAEDLDFEKAEQARLDAIKNMEEIKSQKNKIDMEAFIEAEEQIAKSLVNLKLSKKNN
ncbi:F0F1 ATP synthase subunit epsilon [Candidatus Vampirococcus lugosii]|uniref:ATP synthase epsilon chain n=1 Tax=Candidatus Vampirococcus lugosii TaxID=2789015 RepID=A0ABS5QKT0_9BACT|nr:F0F1 ATP synthase subunit epsilon [Candidatus Vampirococcus lugosii]MBS8121773.1 FoF1-type ATP synthase, epsilon subunit [Candidatus Vampirococcus lugosii]